MKPFILGINGSPHVKGVGAQLLEEALDGCLSTGAETLTYHLVDPLNGYVQGEYRDTTPPGLELLFEQILRADGIIFSTPTYWFNMSALMKSLMEYLTNLELRKFALEGKVAGLIATCKEDGAQGTLSLMAAPLVHMGFLLPPYSMVFRNTKMADKSENNWQKEDILLLGQNVVQLVNLVKETSWGYE